MLRRILIALTAAATIVVMVSGCGSGPADSLNTLLDSIRNADRAAAVKQCYDKYSYAAVDEALQGQVYDTNIKVVSVTENGSQPVREKGYSQKAVASVDDRIAGPLAQIEARYKPLIDQANAVLTNANMELKQAREMLTYAAQTYGRNMPQYYTEQQNINAAIPRVRNAQAKVDLLNSQKQNEIDALRAAAQEQYKTEKQASDKDFDKHSVRLPTSTVKVELTQGGSSQKRSFTLVMDGGVWKVYSLDSLK
jgi:hypothetical protein